MEWGHFTTLSLQIGDSAFSVNALARQRLRGGRGVRNPPSASRKFHISLPSWADSVLPDVWLEGGSSPIPDNSMNAISAPGNPSPRFFIADGKLQDSPTVRQLLHTLEPMRSDESCQALLARFLAEEELYAVPVVDARHCPLALVVRKYYVEFFSKLYSREIFGRRSIMELLGYRDYRSQPPLIVEDDVSIEDVAQRILAAGMQHMVSGFIVSRQGYYLGVANGHDLLSTITQRKQAELYYLAHYDILTGLPNRALLGDRLEQACRDAERKGIDIFKDAGPGDAFGIAGRFGYFLRLLKVFPRFLNVSIL